MKHFAYFFTRQDMSPEQQIVQTAHAAFQLGVHSQRVFDNKTAAGDGFVPCQFNEDVRPEETYFTLIGVRDLGALEAVERILKKFGYRYEMFYEPDLKNGEFTSIAVYPISEFHRDVLMAFNLLKITKIG
jgi:hypothetical protein